MLKTRGCKIPGLKRKPKREGGYFDELPPYQRGLAEDYFREMIAKRKRQGKPVKGSVLPILVGQARRLAKNPPSSSWGRSMQAKKGGYAVQRRYREEGRDPTAKADFIRRLKKGEDAEMRPQYPNRMPKQDKKPSPYRIIESEKLREFYTEKEIDIDSYWEDD
jgi:hypothetical protein